MYKKTVKYVDFNGNEREEDFFFNLTEAELYDMELSGKDSSMGEYLQRIYKAQDKSELVRVFKNLVLKAYGEKSEDGKFFIKEDGKRAAKFAESAAFPIIYMELATDAKAASEFANGIMPADLNNKIDALVAKAQKNGEPPVFTKA